MKKVERDEFRKLIENRWAGGFLEKLEQHNALALLDALDRAEKTLRWYANANQEKRYDDGGARARELLKEWE